MLKKNLSETGKKQHEWILPSFYQEGTDTTDTADKDVTMKQELG